MSDVIEWAEPPPPANRKVTQSRWQFVLDELGTRVGEWALVYEQTEDETSIQVRGKRNNLAGHASRKRINVESVSREVDGKIRIYARVVA